MALINVKQRLKNSNLPAFLLPLWPAGWGVGLGKLEAPDHFKALVGGGFQDGLAK